jgi:hypothetical protein
VPGTRHGEGFKSGNQQYEEAVTHFLASLPAANSALLGSADFRLSESLRFLRPRTAEFEERELCATRLGGMLLLRRKL